MLFVCLCRFLVGARHDGHLVVGKHRRLVAGNQKITICICKLCNLSTLSLRENSMFADILFLTFFDFYPILKHSKLYIFKNISA